jgi:hypothetical protein
LIEVTMSVELFYAPIDDSLTITLEDLLGRLSAAGLPCAVEPDAKGMCWVVLEGHESTLLASLDGPTFLGGTLQLASEDDPGIVETIDAVLRAAGYAAGDEAVEDD